MDVKAQNTQGGTFTQGAWQTRTLNTVNTDGGTGDDESSFCTVSNNQFAITEAGIYAITIHAPYYRVNDTKAKLYDITNSADLAFSSNGFHSSGGDYSLPYARVDAKVVIGSSNTYEVRHYAETTRSTDGFGRAGNLASEIYTMVKIRKIK